MARQLLQFQHGDCFDLMKALPDNSIGAVVTDPPYGLSFMGEDWDAPWKQLDEGVAPEPEEAEEEPTEDTLKTVADKRLFQEWAVRWLKECLRIMKPGGMIKVFGGTRMYHRMAAAMTEAGFEITQLEAWVYGSGFPKSLDVSKALDKAAGAKRDVLGERKGRVSSGTGCYNWNQDQGDRSLVPITEPVTDLAKKYKGYGTCLKPAWEPFLVGRKPSNYYVPDLSKDFLELPFDKDEPRSINRECL